MVRSARHYDGKAPAVPRASAEAGEEGATREGQEKILRVYLVGCGIESRIGLSKLLEDSGIAVIANDYGSPIAVIVEREKPDLAIIETGEDGPGCLENGSLLAGYGIGVVALCRTASQVAEAERRGFPGLLACPSPSAIALGMCIRRAIDGERAGGAIPESLPVPNEAEDGRIAKLELRGIRYQRILESLTNYIYTVAVDQGRVVSTLHHPGCEAVTGYSPSDFAGEPGLWYNMVHPEDKPKVIVMSREILSSEGNLSLVHRIVRKDGEIRWIRNLLVPHFDAEGALKSYDGIINDITDRKMAEERLQESERNLRLIMDSSYDIIFSIDKEGRVLAKNAAFDGFLASQGSDDSVPEAGEATPADLPLWIKSEWRASIDSAFAGKRAEAKLSVEFHGATHFMEGVFNPLLTRSGSVQTIVALIRDVTERTIAERAFDIVVRSAAKTTGKKSLDEIAKNLAEWLGADAAFVGELVEGGTALKTLAARSGGEALPETTIALDPGPCAQALAMGFCHMPKHGPSVLAESGRESRLCMDSHVGIAIKNAQGSPIGLICTMSRKYKKLHPATREIMEVMAAKASAEIERMRIEGHLRSSLEEKEILLREVHHRVKNNLQMISSLVGLQSGMEGNAAAAKALMEMDNRIHAMALAHETLYISENLDKVRVREYIEMFCDRFARSAFPVGSPLRIELRVEDLALPIDKALPCGLILNELVSIATKRAFTGDGEATITVEFGLAAKEGMMRLSVRGDRPGTAAGFPPEAAKSLGMMLISNLARQIGGSYFFEGQGGSNFTMDFPAA